MRLLLLIALLCGCAASPPVPSRTDWVAVDAAIREAYWRANRCVEPNSAKCDALWLIREELEAVIQATRAQFAEEHKRICEP